MTDFAAALSALRGKKPLIHCITNYVTAGDTANMLLALGASPIMADDPAEAAEIASHADALVLNIGTLSEYHLPSMLSAGNAANKRGIPVVLDPVGVQASEFRRTAVREILDKVKISIIRGNLSELLFMGGIPVESHGVDSDDERLEGLNLSAAAEVAQRYDCICVVTGADDLITDGGRAALLHNGTDKLKKVTGAGDMTTAVTAAFAAVPVSESSADLYRAAIFGTAFMGICGELAEERSTLNGKFSGMGTFRAALFDAAGSDPGIFAERIRIEE